MNKKNYMLRIIDKRIREYLEVFGAICIKDPMEYMSFPSLH